MRRGSKIITVMASAILTYTAFMFFAGPKYGFASGHFRHHHFRGHHYDHCRENTGQNNGANGMMAPIDSITQQKPY